MKDTVIVTPTLGNRDTIQRTVESVREFGGLRVNHVLVCPASKLNELQDRFPHCEVLSEPQNCGIYGAINFAFKRKVVDSSLKYLGYINDDDYWLPGFVDLFHVLDSSPLVDLTYGRVMFVNDGNMPLFESASTSAYKEFKNLLSNDIVLFTQQSVLFRRDIFLELREFDESYKLVADSEFWVRAIDAGFILRYLNKVCSAYMFQANQLSSDEILSKSELQRLIAHNGSSWRFSTMWSMLKFRASNLPLYVRRILTKKSIRVKAHVGK